MSACRFLAIFMSLLGLGNLACQNTPSAPYCVNPLYHQLLQTMLNPSVPQIDVQHLFENANSYLILDAREKAEFQVSHISGAVFLGYDQPDWNAIAGIDKNRPIVVYCSVGYRSEKIAKQLADKGFNCVFNLYGSIFEWVNRGSPVYQNGVQVQEIHGYNKMWSVWISNKNFSVKY